MVTVPLFLEDGMVAETTEAQEMVLQEEGDLILGLEEMLWLTVLLSQVAVAVAAGLMPQEVMAEDLQEIMEQIHRIQEGHKFLGVLLQTMVVHVALRLGR
jgi:hypothetical protein